MKLLFILGPTAIGKSSLALQLAKSLNTEIISLDAYQIYKQLNIGTAKPTQEQLQQVKHHMIDIVDADSNYSSYKFASQVEEILPKIKIPILVGGTGFFADSLVYGLDFSNSSNSDIRKTINNKLLSEGIDALYEWLTRLDNNAAQAIQKNNTRQISRAIEISLTGYKRNNNKLIDKQAKYDALNVILAADRQTIYNNINLRVEQMIKDGLINEVKHLMQNYSFELQSMQAIGYKELKPYFDETAILSQCIELVKQHTRNYAKRQLTYFKRMKNTLYIDVTSANSEQIIQQIITAYHTKEQE